MHQLSNRRQLIAGALCLAFAVSLQAGLVHARRSRTIGLGYGIHKYADIDSDLDDRNGEYGAEEQENDALAADSSEEDFIFGDIRGDNNDSGASVETRDACQGYLCKFQSTCGQAPLNKIAARSSGSSLVPYIANGTVQNYGDWPSFARLRIWKALSLVLCGGVIISDRHILTRAACVSSKTLNPFRIEVVLGEHNYDTTDANEKVYLADAICVLPEFTRSRLSGFNHDLAVLHVRQSITFSDYIQPACVPDEKLNLTDSNCVQVGLGPPGIDDKKALKLPDFVRTMPVSPASCESYKIDSNDASRTCFSSAKSGSNAVSCAGDLGGPVLCLDKQTKRWTVVALLSHASSQCTRRRGKSNIGVYSRLTTLLPKLKQWCNKRRT